MPSPETLVQPILLLIDKDAPPTHLDAVKAAASASVDAIAEDCLGTPDGSRPEVWRQWLSGPFTKTVRRANPKQWAKLPAPSGEAACGSARTVAYRPSSYDSLDKAISRLQVSGTDLAPSAEESPLRHSPVLVMNASLGMTTGKASAQAAHALMAYWLKLDQATDRTWALSRQPVQHHRSGREPLRGGHPIGRKGDSHPRQWPDGDRPRKRHRTGARTGLRSALGEQGAQPLDLVL